MTSSSGPYPAAVATAATNRSAAETRTAVWTRLTAAAAVAVTMLDVLLLQRKHAVFTGGFLAGYQFGTFADGLAFVLLTALLNAAIIAPLTFVAMRLASSLRLKPWATAFLTLCGGVLPLAAADFVMYQVWTYLGDAFDFHVMYALTGHRIAEAFAVTAPLMSRPLGIITIGLLSVMLVVLALQRWDRQPRQPLVVPGMKEAVARWAALFSLTGVIVAGVAVSSEAMNFALRRTPSGQVFTLILDRISDVDGDGYGLLRNPKDVAPFDAAIHPYALDIPGNGIDEDGLAGDLPQQLPVDDGPTSSPGLWPRRPTVLLFVLESVRADVLGATYEGRRVTPELDGLAAGGVRVKSAWAHSGSTTQSRSQLLTGSLLNPRGRTTLLDDFKNQGYEVAYFSGQDDDFGNLGIDYSRVDKYYDARKDVANRYSASTTPGSLAVPLHIVERRIAEYLGTRSSTRPLFLYVNFHDTHYPYSHEGLENLLGGELLSASEISPLRRADLRRTYLNAVGNVDQAIGRVINAVRAQVGKDPAVVVVGDHGESLFEQGILGHGFTLSDAQTRVPMIIRGLPAVVETPFSLSDLRRTIVASMQRGDSADARPAIDRVAGKQIFQYVGSLETPTQVGWVSDNGALSYDFRSNTVRVWEGEVPAEMLAGEPRRLWQQLVFTWETLVLQRGGNRAGNPRP